MSDEFRGNGTGRAGGEGRLFYSSLITHHSSLLRRLLVLAAFAYWQGGFTFYAGVVVPLGTEVLGGAGDQARVTRLVTWYLSLSGAAVLAVFALDVIADPRMRRARWPVWAAVALLLVVL